MVTTLAKAEVYSKLYDDTFLVELTYHDALDNGNPWDEPYHLTCSKPNGVWSSDYASRGEALFEFRQKANCLLTRCEF